MRGIQSIISSFTLRMAFRDARPQWRQLFLYVSSVIAGVAALVAILSFRSDLLLTIDRQARELLGSDLELRSSRPFPEEIEQFTLDIGGAHATSIEFGSMAQFPSVNRSRLVQVRAMEGEWPVYGEMKTFPEQSASTYQIETGALVEASLMKQFGLSIGDSVRIGTSTLVISGELRSVPGESEAFTFIGPRIYVPERVVRGTSLLQRGSRITYKKFFYQPDAAELANYMESLRPLARENRVRFDTVESRKEDFRAVADNLSRFLGLIGFIALLLGSLGVASSFYVYMKKKIPAIATLRCLGVDPSSIFAIFLTQVVVMGFAGSLTGAVAGVAIQQLFPAILSSFLPFDIVQEISWPSILLGIATGTVISTLFSLLPLISVSRTAPMRTLRTAEFSPVKQLPARAKLLFFGLIIPLLLLMVAGLTGSWITSMAFTITLIVSVALLWLVANLLMQTIRRAGIRSFPYVWRQGLANLFRPNNQTALLLVAIGMGMLLIGTLFLTQDMLLRQITVQSDQELPDLVLFDVQTDQNEQILNLIEERESAVLTNVPIVTMRLSELKGRTVADILTDTARTIDRWALNREYRVTYREELKDSETLLEGEWIGRSAGISEVVPISISDDIAEELQIGLMDSLLFNVQGVPVETYVASIRRVNFQRPEPNFFVLFPAGVLEPAPQFYATTLTTPSESRTLELQNEITLEFPNVSVLDIRVALRSVQDFLDKVAVAIQFMAFFSILTGFFVLTGSIAMTQKQRVRESVLLRTLGGTKKQVSSILSVEYLLLGSLAVLTGLLLSVTLSWALAFFYFDIAFIPSFAPLLGISLGVILIAFVIGRTGSRQIFRFAPNEILRMQNG